MPTTVKLLSKSRRHIDKPAFNSSPIYRDYGQVIQYWMLILLVQMGGYKKIMNENVCTDDDVMISLGITHGIENPSEWDYNATRATLFDWHAERSESPPGFPTHTTLAKNIRWLGDTLALTQVEQDILHFRIVAARHVELRTCLVNTSNTLDTFGIIRILGNLLGYEEKLVEEVFNPNATLFRTGLLEINSRLSDFFHKLEILVRLGEQLQAQHGSGFILFKENFVHSKPAQLSPEHYPHLHRDITLLDAYLRDAVENRRAGVNILIHGSPGSGKTEFVRMMANTIGQPLFEIATEDSHGQSLKDGARFRSYQMSQHILATHTDRPFILFDEVEDVFAGQGDSDKEKPGNSGGIKAWVNRLLEENPLPTFWLTNNLDCIDRAFLRRFDFVIEICVPPRSVRSKIIDQYLGDLALSSRWKARMAEHDQLNPAVLERVAKVILRTKDIDLCQETAIEHLLGNTLEALGLPRTPRSSALDSTTNYRLDVLNTDSDIGDLCAGLRETGEGRICLYGPPGTGKSALGKYLSEILDRPLMAHRASDILSPYVGIAERNMARMFRDAQTEAAILLLDEADTFLQDRSGASKSWEISQVNEMLTQMEGFNGIFIASTNLMDALDKAALRRFDLKIKFDYLTTEQAWKMFVDISEQLAISIDESIQPRIAALKNLTPGDFANVMRQSRLQKIGSMMDLANRLMAECSAKSIQETKRIGFLYG